MKKTLRYLFALLGLLTPGLARAVCSSTISPYSSQPSFWGYNPTVNAGGPGYSSLSMDATCDLNVAIVSGGGGGGSAPYSFTGVAGSQSALAVATSTALTVPGTATFAQVMAIGGSVNYSLESDLTPTATVGFVLTPGQPLWIQGATVATAARFIDATGSTGTLTVQYFK